MGKDNRKSEAGSGGKNGHSNMAHWDRTEEIKDDSRRIRRRNDSKASDQGLDEFDDDKENASEQ